VRTIELMTSSRNNPSVKAPTAETAIRSAKRSRPRRERKINYMRSTRRRNSASSHWTITK